LNAWGKQLGILVAIAGVAIAAEFGLAVLIPDTAWRQLFMFALVNVIVALSLNVINGMAGQFSIGHAGFVGIGAYTSAIVASHLHATLHPQLSNSEIPVQSSLVVVPIAIVAAAIAAGIFGLVVGLPSLRLKGDYLAVVTLGFAEIFRLLVASASPVRQIHHSSFFLLDMLYAALDALMFWLSKLGGQQGYAGPDEHGVPQYAGPFWVVGGVLIAVVVSWRLKFSGWGRALRALREDEIAAAAVGVDPTRYKVTSFVIAAMGGGFAGALLALMRDGSPTVQPDTFGFLASFDAITMVILGGSGSVSGAVLGGIFVTVTVKLIEQLQRLDAVKDFTYAHPSFDLNACRMVFYAAVLIAIMILRPAGVFGENEIIKPKKRVSKKVAAAPPEALETGANA
jgi:branched-chain amino acid transport system permease protein